MFLNNDREGKIVYIQVKRKIESVTHMSNCCIQTNINLM